MAERIRLFPRTTGVRGTAICDHAFAIRIPVPAELAGKLRTEQMETYFEQVRANAVGVASSQLCPPCRAGRSLNEVRQSVQRLAEAYDLPTLPPMTGSVRQQAFAEQVRFLSWSEAVFRAERAITRTVVLTPLGLQVMCAAVRQHFPDGEADSADLHDLAEQMARRQALPGYFRDGHQREAALVATWLVVRHLSEEAWMLREELDSERWVKASRGRARARGRSKALDIDVTFDTMVSAYLVATLGGWKDRFHAEAAFRELLRPLRTNVHHYLSRESGRPLQDVLEEVAVLRTLDDASKVQATPSWPF
jgi:hypothetical protein